MKTCARVRIEAEAALIEGSPLPSQVSAHLGACPACEREVAELGLLFAVIKGMPVPAAPADLSARVTAAVLADLAARQSPKPFYVRAMRPLMAAASTFVVVLGFVVVTGSALLVGAAWRSNEPMPTQSADAPTATPKPPVVTTPATPKPTAPATDPAASEAPASVAPTPTPAPTDLPRRTPEPASPTPSGETSTAAPGSTSP